MYSHIPNYCNLTVKKLNPTKLPDTGLQIEALSKLGAGVCVLGNHFLILPRFLLFYTQNFFFHKCYNFVSVFINYYKYYFCYNSK